MFTDFVYEFMGSAPANSSLYVSICYYSINIYNLYEEYNPSHFFRIGICHDSNHTRYRIRLCEALLRLGGGGHPPNKNPMHMNEDEI